MENPVFTIISNRLSSVSGPLLFLAIAAFTACSGSEDADLVLHNGVVYTVDEARLRAGAVVITGNKITAVCEDIDEAGRYVGSNTRVVDLGGTFVTPGMIDGHVHFNRAGALINDANLMTVSDEKGLRNEIARVVGILDDGEWITEGLWGAYEQWVLVDAGQGRGGAAEPWRPHRRMIDDITRDNPVFICRYDYREWLANEAALRIAGLYDSPAEGMETGVDGSPTGIIYRGTPAFEIMRQSVAPKSHERIMDENRAALKALREAGIVEVHDISIPAQEERFALLREEGELTCRVWLRPDLSRGPELGEKGFSMGLHPVTREE